MANFKTHVSIAFLGSSGTALIALNNQLINWLDAPWLIFLGTIGGLLPDIDSDNSKQVRILFFLLAVISTVTILKEGSILQGIPLFSPSSKIICHATSFEFSDLLNELSNQCLPYSLILLAIGIFIFVRYILFSIFTSLTVHRGVFHSILAALFFALITTCISYYFLKQSSLFSWVSGLFICVGFIIHLLLDEAYSVDLANSRIKRSFGTALKLYGYRSPFSSLLMLLCTAYLYSITPSSASLIDLLQINNKTSYSHPSQIINTEVLSTWVDYLLSYLK